MRVLIDINHPAHVHLFKNVIQQLQDRGDEVRVTARDKDLTFELLDQLGIAYTPIPATEPGFFKYINAVLISDWIVLKVAREFDPDFLIGTSFAAAHVSKLLRGRSIVFGEDDWASAKQFWRLVIPFADYIATPDSIPSRLGKNHLKYAGCQELAYLSPHRFKPDHAAIRDLVGEEGSYSLVRFVSLGAFHDKDERGISTAEALQIIELLQKFGRVFVTAEGDLDEALQRYRLSVPAKMIHHVLSSAKILVSDSQSMTIEAAILATPSIRINSFVGRIPVIEEMERKYALTYGFLPSHIALAIEKIEDILSRPNSKKDWREKRDHFLNDKIDLNDWIIKLLDELHES